MLGEKLIEILRKPIFPHELADPTEAVADYLLDSGVTVKEGARPIEEWNEDFGDVLWWKFPIEEPPYVGSQLDENWSGYHTHWTFIPIPQPPKGE